MPYLIFQNDRILYASNYYTCLVHRSDTNKQNSQPMRYDMLTRTLQDRSVTAYSHDLLIAPSSHSNTTESTYHDACAPTRAQEAGCAANPPIRPFNDSRDHVV